MEDRVKVQLENGVIYSICEEEGWIRAAITADGFTMRVNENKKLLDADMQVIIDVKPTREYVGVAHLKEGDTWDEELGKRIALQKAMRGQAMGVCRYMNKLKKILTDSLDEVDKQIDKAEKRGLYCYRAVTKRRDAEWMNSKRKKYKKTLDAKPIIIYLFKKAGERHLTVNQIQRALTHIYNELSKAGSLNKYATVFDISIESLEQVVLHNSDLFSLDEGSMCLFLANWHIDSLVKAFPLDSEIMTILDNYE